MRGGSTQPASRWWFGIVQTLDLLLFIAALLTIAVVLNYFAHRPGLRLSVDATKTRAYSLSDQTRELLAGLEGEWTIALVMVEDEIPRAIRRQIDEVLRRYRDASPAITVTRVDPTDPATLVEYEALIGRLRVLEAERIAEYEAGFRAGVGAFEELLLFAQQQAGQLETVLGHLGEDDPARDTIQQRLGPLALLAQEGHQVLEAIATARHTSETQPLPDFESARSILVQALSQWADELYGMATVYRRWLEAEGVDAVLAQFASTVQSDYQRVAMSLAVASDPLAQLAPLELSSIGQQLKVGEVALIMGPDRSAVIPGEQLFPRSNLRELGDGAVAFDRRFRGDQVIAAAIRSLLAEQMPMVVFVHAEAQSLLRASPQNADLLGVAALMEASRWQVREWSVPHSERPVPEPGQPVAWIVIPPMRRQGIEPDQEELMLIRAAERLIADGAAVMLNIHPSLLPRYRQVDPWERLATPFDLKPQTVSVVLEAVTVGQDQEQTQTGQAVRRFPHEHPVARAAEGQQAYFPLPVPLEMTGHEQGGAAWRQVVAEIQPSARRWKDDDWLQAMTNPGRVERGDPLVEPVPIFVAARRVHPTGDGSQRFMLCGSGSWLLSYAADAVTPIGGGRRALTNPGNQELALASVAWLAGMDELIAASPVSRQVARLEDVAPADAVRWGLITVVGMPLACLALGFVVWFFRRL